MKKLAAENYSVPPETPRDNEVLAPRSATSVQKACRAKMQPGSGWWFNDQKDGMERQMTQLAQPRSAGAALSVC